MKLHQLRYLCEVVDNDFNVTRAAARLHTSPSGISKQLRILEDELGAELLQRRKTRITGATRVGKAALATIRKILKDVDHVRRVSQELTGREHGKLVIATTHTHARYGLAPTIERFVHKYPQVLLDLRQGTPTQIIEWVASGAADLGIGTTPLEIDAGLAQIPCYQLRHSVVVPRDHPLLAVQRLTLEQLARYPLITHHTGTRLGTLVEATFAAKGLTFNTIMRATDTSVMKRYVEMGIGVAVLPTIALETRKDTTLRAIPASHLFKPMTTCVIMMKGHSLPDYANTFVAIVTGKRSALCATQ